MQICWEIVPLVLVLCYFHVPRTSLGSRSSWRFWYEYTSMFAFNFVILHLIMFVRAASAPRRTWMTHLHSRKLSFKHECMDHCSLCLLLSDVLIHDAYRGSTSSTPILSAATMAPDARFGKPRLTLARSTSDGLYPHSIRPRCDQFRRFLNLLIHLFFMIQGDDFERRRSRSGSDFAALAASPSAAINQLLRGTDSRLHASRL